MKAKRGFLIKTFAILTSVLLAVTGVLAIVLKNNSGNDWVNAAFNRHVEFTGVDQSNIVFSIEKVGVIANEQAVAGSEARPDFTSKLYSAPTRKDEDLLPNYLVSDQKMSVDPTGKYDIFYKYYYRTINDGAKSKYVVYNNDFVMLNNSYKDVTSATGESRGYYMSNGFAPTYDADGNQVELQEAIMLSFGQFVYNPDTDRFEVIKNDDEFNTGAGLGYVSYSTITRNGENVTVPLRSYIPGVASDFAMIIEQKPENEGYWEIKLNYNIDGVYREGTFGFYLLFNSSYTGAVNDVYEVAPNIMMSNNEGGVSPVVGNYYLEDNASYPVLTYDYTKYKLSYTHTANGTTTYYDYSFRNTRYPELVCTRSDLSQPVSYSLPKYNLQNANNVASIVLTDVGDYTFHYEYLYTDKSGRQLTVQNLTLNDVNLRIGGVQLTYYNNKVLSQMKYVTFANSDSVDQVELIVPGAYNKSSNAISGRLMADYDNSSSLRLGASVRYEGGDFNKELENYFTSFPNYEDGSAVNISNLASNFKNANVSDYLDNLLNKMASDEDYIRTNQGPVYFRTNENYNWENCFYIYSKDALTSISELNGKVRSFDRQTTFDSVGYYIVFISTTGNNSGQFRYSVFAFQYNTDTSNVVLKDNLGKELSPEGYTNNDVIIMWNERGVFERKVNVTLSSSQNKEVFANGNSIVDSAVLMDGVYTYTLRLPSGLLHPYMHYRVGINVEGLSTIYNFFTIDKEAISGINVYQVEEYTNTFGVKKYRALLRNGDKINIDDATTNGLAGISWADKLSGANIKVSYTITPFVPGGNVGEVNVGGGLMWHTTPYRLGNTSNPMNDIVSKDDVNPLVSNGIYTFTFTDDAGNRCYYSFVIDKTENYFKISDNLGSERFATSDWLTYYDTVYIQAGTHKAVDLNLTASNIDNRLLTLIEALSENRNIPNGYYAERGNNFAALARLFDKFDGKTYFTVANSFVEARTMQNANDASLSLGLISSNAYTIRMDYKQISAGTSLIRNFYLVGANNKLAVEDAGAKIIVEINTDSSLGRVYFGDEENAIIQQIKRQQSSDGVSESGDNRLITGSDNGQYKGIDEAEATSDNFVVFTWLEGSGVTKIKSVELEYFRLADTFNDKYYYYNDAASVKQTLYSSNGSIASGVSSFVRADGRTSYIAVLNTLMGQSQQGLYKITRTYEDSDTSLPTNDRKVLTYYFIVDRNEIIDVSNNIIGGGIYADLMGEYKFNRFTRPNLDDLTLEYGNLKTEYSNYLNNSSASKLPVVMYVPISKYFDGTNISNYYSGRLQIAVYFVDSQNQLSKFGYDDSAYKLYEKVATQTDFSSVGGDSYYKIDITSGSSISENLELKNLLVSTAGNTNWFTLPGDYVIVLSDMVKGSNVHQKTIGLRIRGAANLIPSVDVFASNRADSNINSVDVRDRAQYTDKAYYLATNKQYVKINIPNYVADSTDARVDPGYILIKRDGNNYLNLVNGRVVGNGAGVGNYSYDSDGNLTVYLDTGIIINDDGTILPNYEKALQYTVAVRYKVPSESMYSAYYYYDNNGNKQYYYEAEYTVNIDRIPPQENINNLLDNDEYLQDLDVFENSSKSNVGSGLVFATHYKNLYNGGDKSFDKAYAFKVQSDTRFIADDVRTVYINKIDANAVRLADVFAGEYLGYSRQLVGGVTSYGELLTSAGYYEIVEEDECGNVTQYVVFYDAGNELDRIRLTVNYNGVNHSANASSGNNIEAVLGARDSADTSPVVDSITAHKFNSILVENNAGLTDRFYRFEIINKLSGSSAGVINTNFNTDFANLGDDIINMFIKAGWGNYTFLIVTRTETYRYTVNYLEERRLNIEKLIEPFGGGYALNLAGANERDGYAYYYATRIEFLKYDLETNEFIENRIYYCDSDYNYRLNGVDLVLNNRVVLSNGNYRINMTDANGNVYNHLFSTSPSQFYYDLNFGEDGTARSYTYDGVYYAFDKAVIRYNTFYFGGASISYDINGVSGVAVVNPNFTTSLGNNVARFIEITNGRIVIKPYFENNAGGIIRTSVGIVDDEGRETFRYDIVLDTNFGSAATLVDDRGKPTEMNFNTNVDIFSTVQKENSRGTRFLTWTKAEEEDITFNYTHTLYEQLNNGEYKITNLEEVNNIRIDPTSNSAGLFRFVIVAHDPNGNVMGNVVYTFFIHTGNVDLYTVSVGDRMVDFNAKTTLDEIIRATNTNTDYIVSEFNTNKTVGDNIDANNLIMPNAPIELYIYNAEIEVKPEDDRTYFSSISFALDNNIFNFYRIGRGNVVRYIATLQTESYDSLISDVRINNKLYSDNRRVLAPNDTFADADNRFVMSFVRSYGSGQDVANLITAKNVLLVDVYYYDAFVNTIEYSASDNLIYEFVNSGRFNFVFRDLSGNVAAVSFTNGVEREVIVTLLKEVALSVNGQAPIPNAYYNGNVAVTVLNPGLYNATKQIEVYYSRNGGAEVRASSNSYTFNFSASGWYKVRAVAVINNTTITRTIEFTIVNANEAYHTFSLNNRYVKIKQVFNSYGRDVTEKFVELLNADNGSISYDTLTANTSTLGIGVGKQQFRVVYECEGDFYPTREVSFAFTLNNETPVIESSLKPGDSSTKGFSISFNAGEIYRMVGDCYLYVYRDRIGGDRVYSMTINSNTRQGEITNVNFDRNSDADDGDYYVVLVSDSGNYHNSFKVTIKEPLNRWAIIVIVVVSVIVGAIVVSIILLRKRMRIR